MGALDWITGRRPIADAAYLAASAPAPAADYSAAGGMPLATPFTDDHHLERITAAELWGTEHLQLGRRAAMSVPAIARARHVVCAKLARAPITAMTADDRPAPAQSPLLTDPDPERTTSWNQKLWTVDDLIFHGRSYWVITRRFEGSGQASRARRVDVSSVTYNEKTGRYVIDSREYPASDVIRFDGPHEGILRFAGNPIAAMVALERAYGSAAKTPVPNIELHYNGPGDLDDDEIDKLIDRWAAARRGENGGVSFTSRDIEVRTHGSTSENLLVQGRNAAALDAARLIGVPASAIDASMVGGGSSLNYTNAPARMRELIDTGLDMYAAAIESALTAHLPRGQRAAFDFDQFTRSEFKDRMAGYQVAIEAGIYTEEECRELERGEKGRTP